MKFSVKTLGCKINQFDAGALADALTSGGAVRVADGEVADVYIIQTCTVTGKSDYQCRQAIRRAVKEKPAGAKVVVTGCYAETSPDEIRKIPGVDIVAGNSAREALPGMLLGGAGEGAAGPLPARAVTGRSRAYLKVQEGCDNGCSYCIVPAARGASRSAGREDVLARAGEIIGRGYHEIVVTGVHLGGYGLDLGGGQSLSGLLGDILELDGIGRVRLSSIEPTEFDDRLFGFIGEHAGADGLLCRHFHVPLQSASGRVLGSMGRRYSWDEYLTVMGRLDRAAPGSCLGADVIVGYPEEDAAAFEETYERIHGSPLNYLHVFSYSPRPGTRAHAMGDPVPGNVKKERSARLRELAASKWRAFAKGFEGSVAVAVAEEKDGSCTGLTDNYIRVSFDCTSIGPGKPVRLVINKVTDRKCIGELV